MSLDQMSSNDKVRLNQFFDATQKNLQEIEDLKASMSDMAKALAEEFNIKPALLLKAARVAFKSSLQDDKEVAEQIEAILVATGRG
jgi:inorganic pyrophosphatase